MELDKLLHFIFSYAILTSSYILFRNLMLAVIVTFSIGFIKEIYDIWGTGFSVTDLVANMTGIICAVALIIISWR